MRRDNLPNKGLPPVENVSEQQLRKTQAEIADVSGEMPELDLHDQTGQEASDNISAYITSMASTDKAYCRIIHGKGTGILQQVVSKEIREFIDQRVIETYFQSQKYPGAAVVVVFPL